MVDLDLGSDYQLIERIGRGAYSTVWRTIHIPTGNQYAIKKQVNIFDDLINCKRILREIKLLRLLKHQNIVKLVDVRVNEDNLKFNSVSLVLELGAINLKKILKSAHCLVEFHVKKFIYELFLALKYMHSVGVIHRDLKPANVLIFEDESIKLCDLGLARFIAENRKESHIKHVDSDLILDNPEEATPSKISTTPTFMHRTKFTFQKPKEESKKPASHRLISTKKSKLTKVLTSHVATRWYRAPEVILMEKTYGAAIDIWSIGCIFAELLTMLKGNSKCFTDRKPLFPGISCYPLSPGSAIDKENKDQDQLSIIMKVLGTPKAEDYAFISNQTFVKELEKQPLWERENFKKKYPSASDLAIDLLDKLLVFNPYKRLTVDQCLEHPYFEDMHDKSKEATPDALETMDFEFEAEDDLTEERLRALFLEEVEIHKKMREANISE